MSTIQVNVQVLCSLTERTRALSEDMTNNAIYGGDHSSSIKLPQEAIYYDYEQVVTGTQLLNQGAYD